MTNGCVLDNISRPHRQSSNAARQLKCFWRRCRINTNRIGIQKEVTWTFGGTEGQQALSNALIMVALWNRADHYIFMLWFVVVLLLSFFPRLISAAADWMSAILPHEFKMQV